MLPGRFLITNPNSIQWLETMATKTGRMAAFGYPDILPDTLTSKVQVLHIETEDAIRGLERLARDRAGKPLPEKHAIALDMAQKLVARIQETKAAVQTEANRLATEGLEAGDAHFAPNLSHGALHSEIRAWTRETLKLPDGRGLEAVREAMADFQVASAVYHAPHFLTGLAKDVHTNMRNRAIELHLPTAWKQVQQGIKLMDLPPRYDRAAKEVHGAFYEPHQIELWNTRHDAA